jgi:prevent-host-death family protein
MRAAKPLNIHEAKAHFSELLDRAHAGQEIVVSKKGTPWAKIVPLGVPLRRELGFGVGTVGEAFFEPLPAEELNAWESPAPLQVKPITLAAPQKVAKRKPKK